MHHAEARGGCRAFAYGTKISRGCRACARHDGGVTARGPSFSAPGV